MLGLSPTRSVSVPHNDEFQVNIQWMHVKDYSTHTMIRKIFCEVHGWFGSSLLLNGTGVNLKTGESFINVERGHLECGPLTVEYDFR